MISFHYENIAASIFKDKTALKVFIPLIFQRENKEFQSLTYVFCTDAFLLKINQKYLNHNEYTDIITFNLAAKGKAPVGDIYISVDRVKENAAKEGTTFKKELHRVIFHAILHLCGYKDKTKKDSSTMRAKEEEYLYQYFG